ncbi:MAG TPA: hypothetical protein VJR47_16870 [Stellaceae bacterium]|nr:hypothetical protein [Stellaceae bacterium]
MPMRRSGMDSQPDLQQQLVAPLEQLLASGGDTRLALDPVSRLNGYGCRPFPRPDAFTFASSTATSISGRAYAAAAAARQSLLRESARIGFERAFCAAMRALRAELKSLLGLEASGCEIVFSPSGTDSQLHATVLARAIIGAPLTSIIAAADETGGGTIFATRCCHFNAVTAQGIAVVKGEKLAGIDEEIECLAIAARTERGVPRPVADMDAEISDRVACALATKKRVVLFAMDSSKFGLRAPSSEALRRLAARSGEGLQIVIDACQTRLGRKRLRSYLDQGFMVLLTGSKFFTGAPFSGALLIPRALAARYAAIARVPAGLREYTNRDDWPEAFAGLRAALPTHANLGMWLRWVSAAEEMRDYFAVPLSFRELALRQFAETVPQLMAAESCVEALPVADPVREEADDQELGLRTIFPFFVMRNGRALPQAQAATLYHALNDDMSPFLPAMLPPMQRLLAARRCHIGQPVALPDGQGGLRGALRISAGARIVSESWGPDLTRARDRLRGEFDQVRAILEKIRLLMRHFDDIEPAYAQFRAAAPRRSSAA